jgi:membrane glycosyltransferase
MRASGSVLRRSIVIAGVLGPLLWVDLKLYQVLSSGGVTSIDIVVLVLFSLCIIHLLFSFVLAVAGFFLCCLHRNPVTLGLETSDKTAADLEFSQVRVAIAVPVYKEELRSVLERLATLFKDLEFSRLRERIDYHLLSDSPQEYEELERAIWLEATELLGARNNLFYRRRKSNTKKKSGNIHEFLVDHHASYAYFCVLDADSTLTGQALMKMLQIIDGDDTIGAVQTVPYSIRGESLFARLLEWNSQTYSRLFGCGFSFWQGDQANYYGHNALIRTEAFWNFCDLPEMPGKPPFGGMIMSHDFVESALLVKKGYRVVMLPSIEGSYEEIPNSLVDFLVRDRRWMLGNLQHIKVAYTLSLSSFSRFQLVYGAYCYLASVLWFLFLLAATIQSIFYQETHVYFSTPHQLFPDWPVSQTVVTLAIYLLTLGLIIVPKLLGLIERAINRGSRISAGRVGAAVVNFIVEFVSTALLAPIVMMFHLRFLWGFLLGQQVAWDPQQRGRASKPLSSYFADYGWLTFIGFVWFGVIFWSESPLVWWIIPVLVPLMLAPILTWIMEGSAVYRLVSRLGLFYVAQVPRVHLEWKN